MSELTNNLNLIVVIMAGGAGTRFWPVSTEKRPKQFLTLFGERSLIQMSYDRIASLVPPERVLVLTNERFVHLVKEQLPQLPDENIIGEPLRRDTAAAVALAALLGRRRFGNPVIATLTADHLIEPIEEFQRALLSAAHAAEASDQALYTFGIKPTFAATGFGYLQRGDALPRREGDLPHYRLLCFREKPDGATARQYVHSGEYYWNSGMFVWTANAILSELTQHLPEHLTHLQKAVDKDKTADWPRALTAGFEPLKPISVDFGVMEKAAQVCCVTSEFNWDDVGGWLALEKFLGSDEAKNVHRGHLYTHDAQQNLIFCEDSEETVALVGVKDLIVVRSGNKTLILPRSRTEEIKAIVKQLDETLR